MKKCPKCSISMNMEIVEAEASTAESDTFYGLTINRARIAPHVALDAAFSVAKSQQEACGDASMHQASYNQDRTCTGVHQQDAGSAECVCIWIIRLEASPASSSLLKAVGATHKSRSLLP